MPFYAITVEQCRAARALLGWSRRKLAINASVSERTVIDFERGARKTYEMTIRAIRFAIEDAGIDFIDEDGGGVGVRFRDRDMGQVSKDT